MRTENNDMKERLTELEIKLSLAENFIEELNRTMFRQQERIDLLQEQLRLLYKRIQAQSPAPTEPRDLRDDIPPHH